MTLFSLDDCFTANAWSGFIEAVSGYPVLPHARLIESIAGYLPDSRLRDKRRGARTILQHLVKRKCFFYVAGANYVPASRVRCVLEYSFKKKCPLERTETSNAHEAEQCLEELQHAFARRSANLDPVDSPKQVNRGVLITTPRLFKIHGVVSVKPRVVMPKPLLRQVRRGRGTDLLCQALLLGETIWEFYGKINPITTTRWEFAGSRLVATLPRWSSGRGVVAVMAFADAGHFRSPELKTTIATLLGNSGIGSIRVYLCENAKVFSVSAP